MRTANIAQSCKAWPNSHTFFCYQCSLKHRSNEHHLQYSLPQHHLQSLCDHASRDELMVYQSSWRVKPPADTRSNDSGKVSPSSGASTPNATCGFLQLWQVNSPARLQAVWQQQIQPACLNTWQQLQHNVLQQLTTEQQRGMLLPVSTDSTGPQVKGDQQQHRLYLQRLDMLLGSIQQVLLICTFLREHHSQADWRQTATAVFVEARTVEQEICSCKLLQQGLILAEQQLSHFPATPSNPQSNESVLPSNNHSTGYCDVQLTLLVKPLRKHMQLEGLNPLGCAGVTQTLQDSSSAGQAQVLTDDEQRSILSGLHAEHRVLLNRMQSLLLSPDTAPVVQVDKQSYEILMQPVLGYQHTMQSVTAVAAAAERHAAHSQVMAAEQDATDSRVADDAAQQDVDLVLDLQLVSQLLQQHPDADVRASIWSAGIMQRLDKLLFLWRDLADIRLKIARSQGFASYADLVLQHSLVGSSDAAAAVCQQLAAALLPAASAAAHELLQQREQQRDPAHAASVPADSLKDSDADYRVHQASLRLVNQDDLQQLQPFLHLPQIMSGLSDILEATMGLALRHRPATDGEVWNNSVHIYELYDVASVPTLSSSGPQQPPQPAASGPSKSTAGNHLGTIYLDLSEGYSAQLLLYGTCYPVLGVETSQQQQVAPVEGIAAAAAESWGAAPCAVALGLQSHGVLGGSHAQLALGLWELCHELGHAVNFILSATATRHCQHWPASVLTEKQASGSNPASPVYDNTEATTIQPQLYHLHAAWQPLELLELPSTLFESFCMDSLCLQVLCRHCVTKEPLHSELAKKLAEFMWFSHYHPLQYQSVVLAMLYDLEMASLISRQLGRHAAHVVWQEVMSAQRLAAVPEFEASLRQIVSLPRLLTCSGQGYGYAMAWCLAQLLQSSLVHQVHRYWGPAATCRSAMSQADALDCSDRWSGIELWRTFLGAGCRLSDVKALVSCIVGLQQLPSEEGGSSEAKHAEYKQPDDCPHIADDCELAAVLEEHGLWPLAEGTQNDVDLLVVCFLTAFQVIKRRSLAVHGGRKT